MKIFTFLHNLFFFPGLEHKDIRVRIVKRDKDGLVVADKYVDIVSIFNPLEGSIGININQKDIDTTKWKKV